MDYPDNELSYYLKDNSEEAVDLIYSKYKYIIEVLLSKYKRVFLALNIDYEEVKQEANLAFSYAIFNFDDTKDTKMSTFITMCVERRIRSVIKKYETDKSKALSDSVSFDNTKDEVSLLDFIGDETYEPSKSIENIDTINYINKEAKNILSSSEFEVYNLLIKGYDYTEISKILNKDIKQIDNAIQRIKNKIKKIQ